jgi:hypothetical protein
MNDELENAPLREVANRLSSLEQRLTDMQSAYQKSFETYSKSQEVYRQALAQRKWVLGISRVIMLLLLCYIAYRVS